MSQETAMQTWDFQKRNRVRTGERGSIPVDLPGDGTMKTQDGYIRMFILAPAGEDLPALLDWMREEGKTEDLDEEPYASVIPKLNMALAHRAHEQPRRTRRNVAAIPPHQPGCARLLGRQDLARGLRRRPEAPPADRHRIDAEGPRREHRSSRQRGWYVPFPEAPAGKPVEFPGRRTASPNLTRRCFPPAAPRRTHRKLCSPRSVR